MKYGDELIDLHGTAVRVARIVSRLTPAPLIDLYIVIIISIVSATELGPIITPATNLLLCVILMVVSPVLPIIFEAYREHVDLDISDQTMRTRFFLWALFCYLIAYLVYWWAQCDIMRLLSAAYFAVTAGLMLANLKTKVSVHAAGVGGPGTALIFIYGAAALWVIALWVIVVWARVTLRQHTLFQSILGIILGALITAGTYLLL